MGIASGSAHPTPLKAWFDSDGIPEGTGGIVQMNRWLRDPVGSGLYVGPDVRIPGAGKIFDASVGFEPFNNTQIVRFGQCSNGDMIILVQPASIASYSIAS